MLYEPWSETASGYHELRERLKLRGFTNLPLGENQMLKLGNIHEAPIANTSNCNVIKTMIRKNKK